MGGNRGSLGCQLAHWRLFGGLLGGLFFACGAHGLTISVVDPAGAPVSGFRWQVEEDTTHPVVPGFTVADSLSVGIHRSYAPLVLDKAGRPASGTATGATVTVDLSTNQRYSVSILPLNGYGNSGTNVATGQENVTVTVNPLPLPTAQISIFAFHDIRPLNNVPDLPQEEGLPGFSVLLSDAAGAMSQDVFGNPLGTSYSLDANGNPVFDANGDPVVAQRGKGNIKTDANGDALIKYLAPGKYGVQLVPPVGQGWQQTNTIEGTRTIDTWVRAGEPSVFGEFGPPNRHVFFGFVRPFNNLTAATTAGSVSGRVVNAHNSAPPDFTFNNGHPIADCWVGLNELGSRTAVYAAPCNPDSTFTINGVPPGDYQVALWDSHQDVIFNINGLTMPADGSHVTMGDLPVFRWFGTLKNTVFFDRNENGFRDCVTPACTDTQRDDIPLSGQTINLRFRDGSIYQSLATDINGEANMEEVFPFFKYLVAEVDFARLKATGATVITDGGGSVLPDQGWDYPSRGRLTPQPQCDSIDATGACIGPQINPNTGNSLSRTLTGPVLTMATQTFLGLTNVIEWGKNTYKRKQHGGISGIVYYATTRAENDPRYAVGEPWEPGVPNVQLSLYQDSDRDGVIDDMNGDGSVTLSDVDNYPFGWRWDFRPMGPEDVDHNGNGVFNGGDAIAVVRSDSWDRNLPKGCQTPPFTVNGIQTQECFEGLRTFNQVRDGVFDGGYAFTHYQHGGVDSGSRLWPLPQGDYIVAADPPPGYKLIHEEDKNVDFGDVYTPHPLLLSPVCVGEQHAVPASLTLFPGVDAPFAGQTRPSCNRKQVQVTKGKNTAADFFLFTEVPKSARVVGFLLNDFANVFDPNSPSYGEKFGVPWLPVSIQDFAGNEVARVYTDEWGTYNAMVPSTYTVNLPTPSGVSPNMLRVCLNHPGPIVNPQDASVMITDPRFDPGLSQLCYTFDAWPGKTTYVDTPILPVVATSGRTDYPLDCEFPDGTPVIHAVSGPAGGPYVAATGQSLTIDAANILAPVTVPNPAFAVGNNQALTVARDYSFGTVPGSVTLGGIPLTVTNWGATTINVMVPAGAQTGQLVVTRGDNGLSSMTGITVTVGGPAPVQVPIGGSIQAAIDAAMPGDLIMVPPGTYTEPLVLWKPIKLQGWGAASTIIDLTGTDAALPAWRNQVNDLIATGQVDLIPGQTNISNLDEGPGILVLARNGAFSPLDPARIDGFTITGAAKAGGIIVNGYASGLKVSNNRVDANRGNYGGGIRLGQPFTTDAQGIVSYPSAVNGDIHIAHNQVIKNGTVGAAGGGVALFTGSDRYQISRNFICGNFSGGDGAGIGHLGLSDQGLISDNTILFNQAFQQTAGAGGGGGGILIAGADSLNGVTLSPGAGSVAVVNNLIQGNQAGSGDGSGILARFVNGADAQGAPTLWHRLDIFNNIVVNNVTGLAGAIALRDTVRASIINNTIAHNDSTATAADAFSGGPSVSAPLPAGVASRAHSPALAAVVTDSFSNPILENNLLWQNRSFYWSVAQNGGTGGLLPDVAAGDPADYYDLGVLGTIGQLNPLGSVLTDITGYDASNRAVDPQFVAPYVNGGPSHTLVAGPLTLIETIPAFDEGGNFIDLSMGPLTLTGDYHLQAGSLVVDSGMAVNDPLLATDIDGDLRPSGGGVEPGADELP